MHGEGSSDVPALPIFLVHQGSPLMLAWNFGSYGSFGAPVLNQILHQCCTNVLVGIVWWGPLHCDFAVRGADIAAGGPLGRQGLTSGVEECCPGEGDIGQWYIPGGTVPGPVERYPHECRGDLSDWPATHNLSVLLFILALLGIDSEIL